MIDHSEKIDVAEAMEKYGGSFVKKLSSLVYCADPVNLAKIKNAWPEYWDQYLQLSK